MQVMGFHLSKVEVAGKTTISSVHSWVVVKSNVWGDSMRVDEQKGVKLLCKFDPHGKLVHLLTFYTKLKNDSPYE